jgi:hypothetical protein
MKTPIFSLLLGFLIVGCKDKTVKEDLGKGFEISGNRDRGVFTIKQNGIDVARIELNEEFLDYSAHSKDGVHAGHLSTPTDLRSGRGCSATIVIPSADGKHEGHQILERRILGRLPAANDVENGSGVYVFAPLEKKIEP